MGTLSVHVIQAPDQTLVIHPTSTSEMGTMSVRVMQAPDQTLAIQGILREIVRVSCCPDVARHMAWECHL
mgnify:CR=1 FL=1